MGRPGGPGPLDPIFDVETSYGAIAVGNSPGSTTLTCTINQAAGQPDPTNALPILFDVVFSRAVIGFATGDVLITGTAGATTGVVTGGGDTYQVAVSGVSTFGTVIANIPAFVCTAADDGTPNSASTSTDNTVSYVQSEVATAILALNPIGYWKLDETSGSTAFDSSGFGRDGVYNGPTLGGQLGPDGVGYATFDGSNDRVQIADIDEWTLTNDGITIVAMVRPTAGSERAVMAKAGPGQNEYAYEASSDDFRGIVWQFNGSEFQSCFASVFPTINEWNIATWSPPDLVPGAAIPLRLNGSNLSITNNSGVGSVTNGTQPLYIGARQGHADRYFQGALAHVAFFVPKLTPTQIATIESAAISEGWTP